MTAATKFVVPTRQPGDNENNIILETTAGTTEGERRLTVEIVPDQPVELSGDVVVDTLGALDNAKVVDPDAASATIPALLRGNLVQTLAAKTSLAAIATATGTAADDETDATIIGLLTRIAIALES